MLGEDGKVTFYKDPNKKSTSNVEYLSCLQNLLFFPFFTGYPKTSFLFIFWIPDPNKKSTSNVDETLKCPKCGKPIQKNAKAWGCSGWKDGCDFVIWFWFCIICR